MAKTPLMVMGDSNIRNCYVKDIFDSKLKLESSFILTNTKESLAATIEKHSKTQVAFVFHCSWMNEIVTKTKGKEDEAKISETAKIIEEIVDNLFRSAYEKPNWTIVVMKPVRRRMPVYFDQNSGKISNLITEAFYKETPPKNLKLKSPPDIEDKHYVADGVHLNKEGYLLLQSHLIDEISNTIQESELLEDDEMFDFESTGETAPNQQREVTSAAKPPKLTLPSISQTPARTSARNKRVRETEEEDTEKESYSKKIKQTEDRMEAILARMETIMEVAHVKAEENSIRITENTDLIHTNHTFTKMKLEGLDLTIARLKEENDISENERMRDTIIIKKIIMAENVPTKPQDLIDMAKKLANEMITEIMESEIATKYIGLAFPIEPIRMAKAPKEIPPIKVQFRNKEDALDFKNKAIILAKKPNGKYSGLYLVHPFNAATRIRVSILWILAKALKDAKHEAWVAQGSSRPMLMVKKGQYPKSFGFVQAILEHENFIGKCDFSEPNKLATRFFKGEAQRLFIVLNDERIKGKILILIKLYHTSKFSKIHTP